MKRGRSSTWHRAKPSQTSWCVRDVLCRLACTLLRNPLGTCPKESLKNNIGLKFAFRSTDINEIKQTLEFFGIDKDDENNQKRLRDLENGQCLLQDLYGRVGVVQIHPVFEELLHAFDTRPPVKSEVE